MGSLGQATKETDRQRKEEQRKLSGNCFSRRLLSEGRVLSGVTLNNLAVSTRGSIESVILLPLTFEDQVPMVAPVPGFGPPLSQLHPGAFLSAAAGMLEGV